MNVKAALHKLLTATTAITSNLATYSFGTGAAKPAIFTSRIFPENCKYPAIRINQVASLWAGWRGLSAGDIFLDVSLFGNKTHSDKALNELADTIRATIDRSNLQISGFTSAVVLADPPIESADEAGFIGYIVRCRILAVES